MLAGRNAKTCSYACSNKNRKGIKYRVDRPLDARARKLRLIDRDGPECLICAYDNTDVLHEHHLIPKSWQGTDDLDNLILVCPTCHAEVHLIMRINLKLGKVA